MFNRAPSTHHLMDGAIEGVVLCKNEKNDEGHVDVVGISVLHMIQDLKDGQHLGGTEGEQKEQPEQVLSGEATRYLDEMEHVHARRVSFGLFYLCLISTEISEYTFIGILI